MTEPQPQGQPTEPLRKETDAQELARTMKDALSQMGGVAKMKAEAEFQKKLAGQRHEEVVNGQKAILRNQGILNGKLDQLLKRQ